MFTKWYKNFIKSHIGEDRNSTTSFAKALYSVKTTEGNDGFLLCGRVADRTYIDFNNKGMSSNLAGDGVYFVNSALDVSEEDYQLQQGETAYINYISSFSHTAASSFDTANKKLIATHTYTLSANNIMTINKIIITTSAPISTTQGGTSGATKYFIVFTAKLDTPLQLAANETGAIQLKIVYDENGNSTVNASAVTG